MARSGLGAYHGHRVGTEAVLLCAACGEPVDGGFYCVGSLLPEEVGQAYHRRCWWDEGDNEKDSGE